MTEKAFVTVALAAGGAGLAWFAYEYGWLGAVAAPIDLTPAGGDTGDVSDYLTSLSLAEDPTQDPLAKNPYSSASGLYQFTQATWTGLGGDWGTDPSLAFGGLTPSADQQTAMAEKLTAQNAGILTQLGQAVTNASLYTMHIFGAGTGPKVVAATAGADPSTPLASLPGVGSSIVAINPALGSTVGSFLNYLTAKVG